MKYTNEVLINLPVHKVVELFDNPDNLKKWQPGLISFEHLSGTAGEPGAKSKLKYKMGSREMEMIETITVRNLPVEFSGTYEMKGTLNKISNSFIPVSDNQTRYVTENEFQFSGFMKVFGFLFPGMFRKQTQKFLEDFKKFAEGEVK
jgi:carbon monoxide dehydrogenase subunit G